MHNLLSILAPHKLIELLESMGASPQAAELFRSGIILTGILLLAVIANFIGKRYVLKVMAQIIKRSKTSYDDVFLENNVLTKMSHLVPSVIIYLLANFIFRRDYEYPFNHELVIEVIQSMAYLYMVVVVWLIINSFLDSIHDIFRKLPVSKNVSIKGYIQVLKIIFAIVGVILIISVLIGKKPGAIFAGLGAMAAVLMLVFKDSILGLVASIQLSGNKMLKVGDWISMPDQNADGTVLEITLNTVKVQNWDKTITTIPTYYLVSKSFKNWIGMEESGGRRIKRSFNVDLKTIRFLKDEDIDKYGKIELLANYIATKKKEIADYNARKKADPTLSANVKRLTNVGTFRKYVELYLRAHPDVHQNMTFLVRQLQATETGLPLEIYVFSKKQAWADLESIQADIFDHIFAVAPEFGLEIYQSPSGEDIRAALQMFGR